MKLANATIILILITANVLSFYWGGYHTLMPIFYMTGFALTSVIYGWVSLRMKTRNLMALTVISIILAFIDEYSHTTAEVFTYFDRMQPSPLTVFAWGLFIPVIIFIAQFLYEISSFDKLVVRIPRTIPTIISIFMLIICAWMQDYLIFLLKTPALVYVLLIIASLYYTSQNNSGWNVLVMVISLVTTALMEYIGGMEGMWTYHFNGQLPLFVLFTWTLRIWTILAFSFLFGVELPKSRAQP